MSLESVTYALKQGIKPSSLKFLYVVCANTISAPSHRCYGSIGYLADTTGQDRKTVIKGMAELCRRGLLKDTGERVGRTSQIVVYELLGFDKWNGTKSGTVQPGNSTVPPSKESQKRDTDNKTLKSKSKNTRGQQLPDPFELTPERMVMATSKGLSTLKAREEFEHFKDHHLARATVFKDWDAAWRTWIRNSIKFSARGGGGPAATRTRGFPESV